MTKQYTRIARSLLRSKNALTSLSDLYTLRLLKNHWSDTLDYSSCPPQSEGILPSLRISSDQAVCGCRAFTCTLQNVGLAVCTACCWILLCRGNTKPLQGLRATLPSLAVAHNNTLDLYRSIPSRCPCFHRALFSPTFLPRVCNHPPAAAAPRLPEPLQLQVRKCCMAETYCLPVIAARSAVRRAIC